MNGYVGSLKYFARSGRRSLILIISLLVAIFVGVFAIPLIFNQTTEYGGISDYGLYSVFMIVMMFRSARKDSVFLTSRPISRWGIYIAVFTETVAMACVLAVSLIALQNVGYHINAALMRSFPKNFMVSRWNPFAPSQTLDYFVTSFLRFFSTGIIAYTYWCFFTRWKGLTIGLTVGVPLLMFALMLLPIVNDFMKDFSNVVENGNTTAALLVAPKWVDIAMNVIEWFRHNYDKVYWTVVACCVPLSFVVMRTTRHTG